MSTRTRKTAAALAATAAISLFASRLYGLERHRGRRRPERQGRHHHLLARLERARARSRRSRTTSPASRRRTRNIKVKVVGNMTDDKINQALRAGGSNAPDVVSSFTTDNVGKFCSSGAFADLKPFLEKSKIDPAKVFPKPLLDYTQFEGNRARCRCSTTRTASTTTRTPSRRPGSPPRRRPGREFDEVAKKLTKTKGDRYEQLGFMPNYHGYETDPDALRRRSGARRTSTPTASPTSPRTRRSPKMLDLPEGPGRQARRLREAGEVPHHLR